MAPAVEPPVGYEDAHLVGAGATSQVFRAREIASGRLVALKRLRRHLVRDGEALARLRRELEALGRIRHPSIVAVHDLVSWQGDPTLVMELVAGEDLRERIARGPLLPDEVLRIARALLDVLALSHGSGIVHRDLKPQNVRLGADGRVCLLDFGSARLDAASQLTRTATTLGTPDYMAPELFVAPVYDPRVDLYGLGATLFECLAGRPPQVADSLAALAHLRATSDCPRIASIVRGVPPLLARLVDRSLARDPDDRHPSAALALWELDHPEAAGAYAESRAALPPCLRCGLPLPPDSRRCPGCCCIRPFAFGAGRATVLLRDPDPQRLADHVTRWFPERAEPAMLASIATHCAGPERGRLRFVSLVDTDDADRTARALRADGLRAEVRLEPRVRLRWLVVGVFAAAFLALSGRLGEATLAACAALALDRVFAVATARQCLLAAVPVPRPVAPRLHAVATMAALVGLAILWLTSDVSHVSQAWKTLTAGAGLLLAASVLASLWGAWLPRSACPLPSWWTQLTASWRARPAAPTRAPASPRLRLVALVPGAIVWIGLEIIALACVRHVQPPSEAVVYLPPERAVPEPEVQRITAPKPDDSRATLPPQALAPPPTARPAPPAPRPWWGKSLAGLVALPLLFVLRRRVRRRAAAIQARFDLAHLARRSGRPAPDRQSQVRFADALSTPAPIVAPTGDSFVASATRRAALLLPDLPPPSARQLERALEALVRGQREAAQADESLLARCILEADPDLEARLGFLALEGRLEAEAALAWAAAR